jgi:NTP pyrophosphatase (non-canonical NTP hydrolase)
MRTLTELNTLILGWAAERQILKNSTPFAQAKKTAEEVMELIQADAKQNINEIKDAIGDIYVTLVVGLGCCPDCGVLGDDNTMLAVSTSKWKSDANMVRHLAAELLPHLYHYATTHESGGWVYPACVTEIMGQLACIALSYDLRLEECVEAAYEQIKDRKGYLREDGVFVKETT